MGLISVYETDLRRVLPVCNRGAVSARDSWNDSRFPNRSYATLWPGRDIELLCAAPQTRRAAPQAALRPITPRASGLAAATLPYSPSRIDARV